MARDTSKRAAGIAAESPREGNELQGLLVLVTVVLQLLSLHSFALGDSSSNWLGLLGYFVGALMYYLFGVGSYAVAAFCGWIGWRLLFNKPLDNIKNKTLWFLLWLASTCILLNLAEDRSLTVGTWLRDVLHSPTAPSGVHLHLGGTPLFYLYSDLPGFNLKRILNTIGVGIVFFTTFLAGLFGMTEVRPQTVLEFIKNLRPKRQPADVATNLWRNVKLSLSGKDNQSGNLAIKPERDLLKRPSISRKEPTMFADEVPPEPVIAEPKKAPKEPKEPPVQQITKREQALQAQRVYNGDFSAYQLPPLDLLTDAKVIDQTSLRVDLRRQAEVLEETLHSFGIEGKVGQINCGPTITSFEVHPAIGVKVQKIKALENDIALNMEARSIRIIAPIPGKAAVGIEVPNAKPQEVGFKDMMDFYQKGKNKARIPVLLGKAVNGEYVISDLAKMPHCIIAGATGSGKSVCINTIVMSIVYNARPDQIKLLMVDPKKVELTPYSRLPHMLAPVITEPAGACTALLWLVKEMENRYDLLKLTGVRNIEGFNTRKRDPDFEASLDREIPEKMHYIVAIIDELADLMMVSSHDIETPIARIAQMARAVGIHLILATQRPSREVITGLIKANFPTRVSFKVASRVNSQIVLDETGAESLLGNGDMLFLPPGTSSLVRAQGAYIRDEDIRKVVDFICEQAPPDYAIQSFDRSSSSDDLLSDEMEGDKIDSLYSQARELVVKTQNASTTFLQRKLKIGYARAASLIDQLQENEVVSPPEGSKGRRVLVIPKGMDKEMKDTDSEEPNDD
ncbi:MAG: DNA translocase FtsK [Chlamydiales bacterium]|nr:DNA translocase FtsK [Chlamydiales bacterium]